MPDSRRFRTFTVVHTQVGPWPAGHTFAETEFNDRHPHAQKDATKEEVAAYHGDLIRRLLDLGAIKAADPDVEPTPTPPGPENRTPPPPAAAKPADAPIVQIAPPAQGQPAKK